MRAEGLEPSLPYGKRIFIPATAFAASLMGVWGLDYPFTLAPSRFRCCPSSLYTFPQRVIPKGLARDRHFKAFPEFEQFYVQGFPRRTQVCLSPLRLPIPPRPRDRPVIATHAGGAKGHQSAWKAVRTPCPTKCSMRPETRLVFRHAASGRRLELREIPRSGKTETTRPGQSDSHMGRHRHRSKA